MDHDELKQSEEIKQKQKMEVSDANLSKQSTAHDINPLKPGESRRKKVLVIIVVLFIGACFGLLLLISSNTKRSTDQKLVEQNKRLKNFPPASSTDPESSELLEARKKILQYAQKNNITVTENEIAAKKQDLISSTSEEAVKNTLKSYNWSPSDWTEVVRWQLLREKILEKITPSRSGEVMSVRWDAYSPILNEQVASEKKGLAIAYLESVKNKIESKSFENMYSIYSTFDIKDEPIFKGFENKYALQYSGWDVSKKEYKVFLMNKSNPNYALIMSTTPPAITEISCTLGGCQMYNVTSGSNGEPSGAEILTLLTDGKIPF